MLLSSLSAGLLQQLAHYVCSIERIVIFLIPGLVLHNSEK